MKKDKEGFDMTHEVSEREQDSVKPLAYKVMKDDGKEYVAPNLETLKKWVKEKRIKPHNQVYHPILQKWLYIKDMAELEVDLAQQDLGCIGGAIFVLIVVTLIWLLNKWIFGW